MNYIPLALGLLLSIAGFLSIASGYDIITMERGWTEVIAGSVALTGGFITISLWIILQRLSALTALYKTAGVSAAMDMPLQIDEPAPAISAVAPRSAFDKTAVETAFLEEEIEAAARSAANETPARPSIFQAEDEPDRFEHAPLQASFEEPPAVAPALDAQRYDAQAHEAEAPEVEPTVPEDHMASPSPAALSLDEMWRRVSEEIERPILAAETTLPLRPDLPAAEAPDLEHQAEESPSRVAVVSPSHEETPPAPRRRFEPPALKSRAVPEEPPVLHEVEPDDLAAVPAEEFMSSHEDVTDQPVAPQPEESPAAASHDPVSNPAVIGRYESDGTTYIMFEDGSIEAQSEAGIYRFESMAHLKAFIEEKQVAPADA